MSTYALFTFQLVCFLVMLYLMNQMYRQLRRDALRPEQRPEGPEAGNLRAGVGDLIRELRQAADQINNDMTARANTLQKLVDEANEQLKRLDAAAQRANAPARHGRPAAPRPAAARPAAEPDGETPRRRPERAPAASNGARAPGAAAAAGVEREREPVRVPPPRPAAIDDDLWPGAPQGRSSVQVPRVASASPVAASAYRQATTADPFVAVDLADTGKFQAVRRLADQGMAAGEIARAIGLGREEVELIMRVNGESES